MGVRARHFLCVTVLAWSLPACGPALWQCPGIETVNGWYESPGTPVDAAGWEACTKQLAECADSSPVRPIVLARSEFCASMEARAEQDLDATSQGLIAATQLDGQWAAPPAMLGMMAYEAGDLDAARTYLEHAAMLDPDWATPHNELGMVLITKGNLDGALAEFDAAIMLDPLMVSAHANRGGVLSALGRFNESIQSYLVAIDLEPEQPVHYYNLGGAFDEMGEHEKAAAAYGKLLTLLPPDKSAAVHLMKGWSLEKAGLLEEAMLSMMTAVELAPKSINALASLAALQARLTLFDEAWEAYRALGALDPERATTDLYTLGVQLLALDKLGLAAQAFGLTVQIRPDWAEAYALLGTVMIRTGALEGAAQVLEAALVLTPEDASVHNNLGIVYARMFELEKAQAHLRAALEAGPPAAGTHSWLGEVLRLEGRLDDSLAEHDAAIALDPAIPRLHARRAHTLLDMGKKGDAIEAIAAAEAIDAADGETLVVKATLLLAKKKTRPEAIDILMQVIAADPLDAGAHATLALALSKSKTTGARAKESIETALGIDPYLGKNPWVAALAKKLFK